MKFESIQTSKGKVLNRIIKTQMKIDTNPRTLICIN